MTSGEPQSMTFGGIEAGGTKWVCAIGDRNGELLASETFLTTTPSETIARATRFFLDHDPPSAIGIGSFGPVDIRPASPTFGHITTTPKPGWAHADLLTPLRAALRIPVVLDTDVNVAALGEWRWGRGFGLETLSYITVGTGIGGGAIVNGRILHGFLHPEVGHIRIPHDRKRDPFEGTCPYHKDCLEGLASGKAIHQRWGQRGEQLADDSVWELEAEYLALGLLGVIHILAPQRVIVGGGVTRQPHLLRRVRRHVLELIGGYLPARALEAGGIDEYIVPPGLGDRSGVVGAIELARTIADRDGQTAPIEDPPSTTADPTSQRYSANSRGGW
jgi:fructokinase